MRGPSQSLAQLTAGIVAAPPDITVRDVTPDSRAVAPGALFLAFRGRSTHGIQHASQAIARGARAILYDDALTGEDAAALQLARCSADTFIAAVPHLDRQAGVLADRFFGQPSQSLTVAGITGTNGKTTCAWLLAQALARLGRPAGYMGTLGYGMPPAITATGHTTPDVVSVHRQLAALKELGAECVCMEVTSHAMDQERVAAVRFNTAAFTNLTRDHLDYHGTMEAYGAAKARLLDWPGLADRVVNIDDAFGRELAQRASPETLVLTARLTPSTEFPQERARYVRATRVQPGSSGLLIGIDSSWGAADLSVPLVGEFNVDNVLTVLAVLLAWQTPLQGAIAALAGCQAPSGRMEMFGGTAGSPLVVVDFSHTPDSLEKALAASRAHCSGTLRVVFGCGGDRDAGKRPLMGGIAAKLADEVIVTDDNPRTEDPARIVADILKGIASSVAVTVEHDRARAIQLALHRSAAGDVLLIAGKGHEDYQIYGTTSRAFSDQQVVRDELRRAAS